MVFEPDCIDFMQKDRIKKIIGSCELDSNMLQSLSSVVNADSWTEQFGQSLLSSKFIGHLTGKFYIRKCKISRPPSQ